MVKKYRHFKEVFLEVLNEEEDNLDESLEYRKDLQKFVNKVIKRYQTPLKEEKKGHLNG